MVYIHQKLVPPNDDTQNCSICRLQLVVETFGHSTERINQTYSIKDPEVVMPTAILLVFSALLSTIISLLLKEPFSTKKNYEVHKKYKHYTYSKLQYMKGLNTALITHKLVLPNLADFL